nr:hypothetical protein [Tanacetum cinerariifolium]
KKGRTVAITAEDMQKRKNVVKARTTLLLALPDEHHGKSKVPTIQGAFTASAQVPTVSTDVAAASLSYDSKKTGKKITIQGSDVAGFDKSKVECFNFHKWVILLESADHQGVKTEGKERESYKKDPKVGEPAPRAMIAIDGLSQVEARLVEFKENEIKYCEKIKDPERDIELKDNKIKYPRNELEEVKKEKESIDFKIENFENALKDIDRLLGSQKLDKDMTGVGCNEYCAVPPPPAQVYSPMKKDLSWMGLPEFVDDTVLDYTRPTPSIDVSKSVSKEEEERWKSNNSYFFEQGGSSGNVVSKPMIKFVKESSYHNATKVNNTKNARKPTVKYDEMYRNTS